MKNHKNILFFLLLFLVLLTTVSPAMAVICRVGGEEIPCEIFWPQYGWIISIILIPIGLFLLLKPEMMVNWYKSWWGFSLVGPRYFQFFGIMLLIMATIFLYLAIFP